MAGAALSSAGMALEGCRLCGFFCPPQMRRWGVAVPSVGGSRLRNVGAAQELLASTGRALIVTGSYTICGGERRKSVLGRAHRRIGEVPRRPEPCRPARATPTPADKTDSSLRRRPRFTPYAVAGTRSGPRASAPVKDHRGAAKAQAFRRRRAPFGWAAKQPPNDDAHAVDDAVVDAAPYFRH